MLNINEAAKVVREWIQENKGTEYDFHEERTEHRSSGWLFFYNRPYKNHDNDFPIYIDKHDGQLFQVSNLLKENVIKRYEKKRGYIK